jgi:hypothetical protein
MKPPYQPGEVVEAYDKENLVWHKVYFVGYDSHTNPVVEFYSGHCSSKYEIRPIKESRLVPWGPEDIAPTMRLKKKKGSKSNWHSPVGVENDCVMFVGVDGDFSTSGFRVTYQNLYCFWETYDGRPCGKEV